MTVSNMLASMSSRELTYWMAYFELAAERSKTTAPAAGVPGQPSTDMRALKDHLHGRGRKAGSVRKTTTKRKGKR